MVTNTLPAAPPLPQTLGVKRLKFHFLEYDHVSYQNKGNHKCSNMVPWQPPLPSEGQNSIFQNMVMLHTKGNSECRNMVATADRGTINMKHIKRDF